MSYLWVTQPSQTCWFGGVSKISGHTFDETVDCPTDLLILVFIFERYKKIVPPNCRTRVFRAYSPPGPRFSTLNNMIWYGMRFSSQQTSLVRHQNSFFCSLHQGLSATSVTEYWTRKTSKEYWIRKTLKEYWSSKT